MALNRDQYGYHYATDSYKLRSAGPIPVGNSNFITQTFGIDHSIIKTYPSATRINNSSAMKGILGGTLFSASWNRLPYLSQSGEQLFSGTTITAPDFINADSL